MWLCGLSHAAKQEMSEEEQQALERKLTSIEKTTPGRLFCNVNALILLTVNVFSGGTLHECTKSSEWSDELTNTDEKHICCLQLHALSLLL